MAPRVDHRHLLTLIEVSFIYDNFNKKTTLKIKVTEKDYTLFDATYMKYKTR